jgi:ParB family transcriptional regulator, chromosome partitioning protein
MSEKRRALGRGLGALIPSSPGTARPVDVFFRESGPPPAPDGAEPSEATGEHPHGPAHNPYRDASPDKALAEPPVPREPSIGEGNGHGAPEALHQGEGDAAGGHGDAGFDHRRTEPADGLGESDGASLAHHTTTIGDGSDHTAGARNRGDHSVASDSARDAAQADAPDSGLAPVPGATFAILPIAAIRPNPRQPRTVFDEDELAELAASIREIGVLQPVVVRPITHDEREGSERQAAESHHRSQPDGDIHPDTHREDGSADVGPRFELIMGERRLRASQLAGQETIPAIVKDTHDDDLLRDALLENLHRTQLNPLEEAAAYQQLLDDFGCSHDELAGRIGRSRPQISNTIRLLRLPPLVARRLAAGVLSAGHARALLGLDDAAAMERLAQRIVAEGLSVRSVEEIVALGGDDPAAVPKARRPRAGTRHPQLDDLAARLSDRYDTRVTIALGQRKGRLTVEFASVEDLNRIVGLMERI